MSMCAIQKDHLGVDIAESCQLGCFVPAGSRVYILLVPITNAKVTHVFALPGRDGRKGQQEEPTEVHGPSF